jgi:hypothetical protein
MADHITRVESREVYPASERPHYIMNLRKAEVTFYLLGTEMSDDKTGDVIVQLVNALNAAENQIEKLFKYINTQDKSLFERYDIDEYKEEYPEKEDYTAKYKLDDLRDALFHSMMKKDEKKISHYLNRINVIMEKSKNIES